jgi:hypothetical protein
VLVRPGGGSCPPTVLDHPRALARPAARHASRLPLSLAITVEPIGELLEPSPALVRCDARGGDREMGESTVMSTP